MPELPEVQTVVNQLAKKLRGQVFFGGQILAPKMADENLLKKIKNQKIKSISRRGKMIIIELSNELYLLAHLKMTGQLIYTGKRGLAYGGGHALDQKDLDLTKPNKFTRIILKFKDKTFLLFNDLRKFGWLKVVSKKELETIMAKYGVEPLSWDFSIAKFKEILAKRPNLKIKQLLLAQELIAGIGNIYADESLFASGINPGRIAKSLKTEEIKKLRLAIIKILKQSIKDGGTSFNTFVHANGQTGNFRKKLKVYKRGNELCLKCRTILKKTRIAGRGTVYCPYCQK